MSGTNDTIYMSKLHLGNVDLTPSQSCLFLTLFVPLLAHVEVSNLLVIYAVSKFPSLRNPSNMFLLSLAVTDVLCGLLLMPFAARYTVTGEWEFGLLGCRLWLFMTTLLVTCSIYHHCAIAADRYLAIAYPITYFNRRSTLKSLIVIGIIWIYSFLVSFPIFFTSWGPTWPDAIGNGTPCTIPKRRNSFSFRFLSVLVFPMVVLLTTYISICYKGRELLGKRNRQHLIEVGTGHDNEANAVVVDPATPGGPKDLLTSVKYTVHGSKRRLGLPTINIQHLLCMYPQPAPTTCKGCQKVLRGKKYKHAGSDGDSYFLCQICAVPNGLFLAAERSRLEIIVEKERKAFLIISIIIATFIISFLPGFALSATLVKFPSVVVSPQLKEFSWWIMYFSSACNPIIYTIFNKDFRDAFEKILKI